MPAATILSDADLKHEIIGIIDRGGFDKRFPPTSKAILLDDLEATKAFDHVPNTATEAIILAVGRPALMIKGGTFEVPTSDVWTNRLASSKALIEAAIAAVGRIEVKNHPDYEWIGTGWFVAENIIATNRHVAQLFAYKKNGGFTFRRNSDNREMAARIDLREEYLQPDEVEIKVLQVLHMEAEDGPDLALLEVETSGNRPQPIGLSDGVDNQADVAIIGYPAWDGQRNDPEVMRSVFNDIYEVKRLQPGRVVAVNDVRVKHDCSTLGGNSGSPLIDLKTGAAVGLHFGGSYKRSNDAVPSAIVKARLEQLS
jgi:endonuclease G, mitochondrial